MRTMVHASRKRVAVEAVIGTAELAVLLVEAAHVINLIVAQMPDARSLVEVPIRCEGYETLANARGVRYAGLRSLSSAATGAFCKRT